MPEPGRAPGKRRDPAAGGDWNRPGTRGSPGPVMEILRFVGSVAVSIWGAVMVLLGIVNGMFLWVLIGAVVLAVGLPLLASNSRAAATLYPPRNPPAGA